MVKSSWKRIPNHQTQRLKISRPELKETPQRLHRSGGNLLALYLTPAPPLPLTVMQSIDAGAESCIDLHKKNNIKNQHASLSPPPQKKTNKKLEASSLENVTLAITIAFDHTT